MTNFKFNGIWEEIPISLAYFNTFYKTQYTEGGRQSIQCTDNNISLSIADIYGDTDPDPKPEQLYTIAYIQETSNQKKIIEEIITYLNSVIYPFYKDKVFSEDEYPESYPSVNSIDDFHKFFKLNHIGIYALSKNNHAYYCLYFNVKLLDNEHGLSIEMHKERCIDHGTSDGTDGYILAQELSLPKNARDLMHQTIDNEKAILYKPHPKYGTIKPWQVDANRRFAYNAYKSKEDDLLIEYVQSRTKPIQQFTYIYQLAKKENRTKLVQFFSNFDELN